MADPKPLYVIPPHCGLPPADHNDGLGGCWGITHGALVAGGEDYCRSCDYYAPEPEPPADPAPVPDLFAGVQ